MKLYFTVLIFILVPSWAWCNARIELSLPEPKGHKTAKATGLIGGEIVYARIEDSGSQIEAILDIGHRLSEIGALYFPVFGPKGETAAAILARTKFYAHLNDLPVSDIVAVDSPTDAPAAPPGTRIFWFQFLLTENSEKKQETADHTKFKISYWQPHLGGWLYYLPQSLPTDVASKGDRDWRFPMIIRSLNSVISPDVKGDAERIGDLNVVYLRNAKIVAIPVGKKANQVTEPPRRVVR